MKTSVVYHTKIGLLLFLSISAEAVKPDISAFEVSEQLTRPKLYCSPPIISRKSVYKLGPIIEQPDPSPFIKPIEVIGSSIKEAPLTEEDNDKNKNKISFKKITNFFKKITKFYKKKKEKSAISKPPEVVKLLTDHSAEVDLFLLPKGPHFAICPYLSFLT
ncbi:hypothetical protein BY996DRAFT_3028934 [Phakopsora pachyrhizi]|nr:hypothetical protein BY996DRAFT_3028934 [Phakopsora pachyrhizi]